MADEVKILREPAEVWPLASYIVDEMKARDWNSDDLALRMGYQTDEEFGLDLLSVGFLLSVQEDGCLVGEELFRKLAFAFGVSDALFRNLDATWRRWPDRRVPFECSDEMFGPLLRSSIPAGTP